MEANTTPTDTGIRDGEVQSGLLEKFHQGLVQCPRCKSWVKPETITNDHRVPRWLTSKIFLFFGEDDKKTRIKVRKILDRLGSNIQRLCYRCNYAKGGKIDYTDRHVRKILKLLVEEISLQLEENAPPEIIKLKVTCQCND